MSDHLPAAMDAFEDPPPARVLEMPVRMMRVVWAWPDSWRRPWQGWLSTYGITTSFSMLSFSGALYLFNGEFETFVDALGCVGDIMAGVVIINKIQCMHRYSNELLVMRESLQHSFKAVEDMLAPVDARRYNIRCLDRARSFSRGYDMLFLSMCMHISCKCEILQTLIRYASQHAAASNRHWDPPAPAAGPTKPRQHWRDDGTPLSAATLANVRTVTGTEQALRACAVYHQLIIRLRDTTEHVFNSVSFMLMAYLLLGLGIPLLRVLYVSDIDLNTGIFLSLYAAWNFSQLLFYCWFADAVAQASEEVSVAAYAALRPDLPSGSLSGLSVRGSVTLNFLTLRAQRPLYLTAGNLFNLTLVLYLALIRRTQSIYSYLLKLR